MKKSKFAAVILITLLTICALTGCSSKKTYSLTITDPETFETTKVPDNLVNYSQNMNEITVTVNKDGDYVFEIQDEDGNQYSFDLKIEKNKAEVSSEDGAEIIIKGE